MASSAASGVARRLRHAQSAGVLSLLGGITSALTLTGAAFYTVEQVDCADAGQYIRHDNHVEFVGGCVRGSQLPPAQPGELPQGGDIPAAGHGGYRR